MYLHFWLATCGLEMMIKPLHQVQKFCDCWTICWTAWWKGNSFSFANGSNFILTLHSSNFCEQQFSFWCTHNRLLIRENRGTRFTSTFLLCNKPASCIDLWVLKGGRERERKENLRTGTRWLFWQIYTKQIRLGGFRKLLRMKRQQFQKRISCVLSTMKTLHANVCNENNLEWT